MTAPSSEEKLLFARTIGDVITSGFGPIDLKARQLEWTVQGFSRSPIRGRMLERAAEITSWLNENVPQLADAVFTFDMSDLDGWARLMAQHSNGPKHFSDTYEAVIEHQWELNELCGLYFISLQTALMAVTSAAIELARQIQAAQLPTVHEGWTRLDWLRRCRTESSSNPSMASEVDHVANFVKHRDQWPVENASGVGRDTREAARRLGLVENGDLPAYAADIRAVFAVSRESSVTAGLEQISKGCQSWCEQVLTLIEVDQRRNSDRIYAMRTSSGASDDWA